MRNQRGAAAAGWLAAIAAVTIGGAGLGVVVGASSGDSDDGTVDAAVAATSGMAELYRCPGAQPTGVAQPGDRVQATALDRNGDWVELRDPDNLTGRVWIARDEIDPDRALAGLPTRACDDRVAYAGGSTAPTTIGATTMATTTTPSDSTSAPTTTPTDATTAPPPTAAPDTSPPQVSGITKDTEHIYEDVPGVCPGHPTTVLVRATVSDVGGIGGVTLEWSVGSLAGEIAMVRQGSQWSATIGPLGDDAVVYPDDREPMSFTIRAVDTAGNVREADNGLDVFDCTFI